MDGPATHAAMDAHRLHRVFAGLGMYGGSSAPGEEGGVAGCLTGASMSAVFRALRAHAGWVDGESCFYDFGAETGRALLHAALAEGAAHAAGCEVDRARCLMAQDAYVPIVLRRACPAGFGTAARALEPPPAARAPPPARRAQPIPRREVVYTSRAPPGARAWRSVTYTCEDGARLRDLGGATTHVYSFWEGMPDGVRRELGRLFTASPAARALVVVQRALRGGPAAVEAHVAGLGFGRLSLAAEVPVRQAGSAAQYRAYVLLGPGIRGA